MVNNHQNEADLMPPRLFYPLVTIILVFYSSSALSQNLEKHYISFKQDQGTLFFIRPQKGFKNAAEKSHLTYDITCKTGSDSSTLNFSYFDKTPRVLDSLCLLIGSKNISSTLIKLFVETKKNVWHYRYSSRFLNRDLEDFFDSTHEAKIIIIDKKNRIQLSCTNKRWKKISAINRKIFQLIQLNK